MRNFINFPEAQNEIRRDLNEMGIEVHPETMQDKIVGDDPDFNTKELYNYAYRILDPDFGDIEGVHVEWVRQEWIDRLTGDLNPGSAWKTRPEVWEEFLERDRGASNEVQGPGKFSYTYSERVGGKHIDHIIEELKVHPNSRQLWLDMWRPIDATRRGERRVPCTLGYHFLQRNGKLHLTYMMRSCDFSTHYANDVCLATMLLHHVADEINFDVGTFTHFVGSLHVYAKDVAGTF